jgi:hypothetical protein
MAGQSSTTLGRLTVGAVVSSDGAARAEVSGDEAAGAGHAGGEAAGAAVAVEREWGKEKGKKRKNTDKWVPQKSLQNNPNEIYLSSVLPRQH